MRAGALVGDVRLVGDLSAISRDLRGATIVSRVALFTACCGGSRERTANLDGSYDHLLLFSLLCQALIQSLDRGTEAMHAP